MGFQQLGAVERDWRTTSQGDRSKAREIPAPKRRACFKEDKALNGVQIDKRGLVVSIGLATWRLLVVVKKRGVRRPWERNQTGKCYRMSEWESEEVERTRVDNPLKTFSYGQEL